jgi:hypothetical protein
MNTITTQEQETTRLTDAELDAVAGGEPMIQAVFYYGGICLTVVATAGNHCGNLFYH